MQIKPFIASLSVAWILLTLTGANSIANEPVTPVHVPDSYTRDNLLSRWLEPLYPPEAQKSRIEGDVTVEFDIDNSGHVVNYTIVKSHPPGVFDRAVLSTIDRWTVLPYLSGGCIRDYPRTQITVNFRLENGEPNVSASRPVPLSDPLRKKTTPAKNASNDSEIKQDNRHPALRWKHNPPPHYPRRWGTREPIYGNVAAVITVNPDGSVADVEILFSAPYREFGEAAAATIRTWKAETTSGEPPGRRMELCQQLNFRPKGKE